MEEKEMKATEELKAHIRGLLEETQPQFREIFLKLANSEIKEDRDEFMRIRQLMTEYVVPKKPLAPSDPDNGKVEGFRLPDELWILRSGDMRPEKIEHISLRYCKMLEKEGLLFKSRDEAEDASEIVRALLHVTKDKK